MSQSSDRQCIRAQVGQRQCRRNQVARDLGGMAWVWRETPQANVEQLAIDAHRLQVARAAERWRLERPRPYSAANRSPAWCVVMFRTACLRRNDQPAARNQ